MALARTFVSFSSADINYYRTMLMWKAHEHIDFNFADFQLDEAINSNNSYYIKTVCRARIRRADTFVLLIGSDTYTKTVFVKAEVDVAIEKGCRLIGVNLNNCRSKDRGARHFLRIRARCSCRSHLASSRKPSSGTRARLRLEWRTTGIL
jgi:hypothetical protein